MEVCRICLAGDRKMFVLDTKDKQLYESVTGITVQPVDRLPKHICWECRHSMSKYFAFKSKAFESHCILIKILKTNTFTTLQKYQPKSTLTPTGIMYSNLDGVVNEELDEIAAVDHEGVIEIKSEAEFKREGETNFTSYDSGEINVINDNKPKDYTYGEANFTTKETREESVEIVTNIYMKIESVENVSNIEISKDIVKNENEIQNIEKTVKNLHHLGITRDGVKNDIDIETIEETVVNSNNNEILNNLPEDYTDDENESFLSNESDEISHKSIKNISSEPIHEIIKSKKKFGLNKSLQTVEFLDVDTLNRHMEVHSKIPADGPHCERCGLRFASQEAFNDHKTCSTNHADERTTKITPRLTEPMVVNGIQFAESSHARLQKYYAPPGYAPLFGAPLKKPKADSLKVKNSSKISNEDSDKTVYSDANVLELFKKTKHLEEAKEKVNCTETVVGDSNKSLIEKHLKINCEKRKYFCDECNNRFISKNVLKRHKQRCGIKSNVSNTHSALEPYLCTICDIKFILKHGFIRHMRTHTGEKPYSCTVCKKQFSVSSSLNTHMRTHTGEKPYSCTVCKKQFGRSCHLDRHMTTHTGEKPYSCTVCNKQFNESSKVNRHMRTHTGEKPYTCTVCSKQFNVCSSLRTHMRTHTGEKPYLCTVCSKQFSQSSFLHIHLRTHTGEKPYSCTVCKKQFSQSSGLNTHMRTHKGEEPFSCTVCSKQFSQRYLLHIHLRTHTGEKPYSCTVCKKQFSQSCHLDKHMRTHTSEKPYSCTVCKKQFSQSCNLKSHLRTHTGEKPYVCTVCSKPFSESGSLKCHMRIHTGEKPYSCTVCKKQFSQSSSLNTHMRTHTGEKP